MRTTLFILSLLALLATPLTAAQASSRYAVTLSINHTHISQGSSITISGHVSGSSTRDMRVSIQATQDAEPYMTTIAVGTATVAHATFSRTYRPFYGGNFHFKGTLIGHHGEVLATTSVHSVNVVPRHSATYTNQLVVLGDSISELVKYNNVQGSSSRAWWSSLAAKTGLEPHVYARGGSGYGTLGKCAGTLIDGRVTHDPIAVRIKAAKVVVIEAGVNDYHRCVLHDDGTRTYASTTYAQVQAAVDTTMDHLHATVQSDARVYIIVPWGPDPDRAAYRDLTTGIIKASAAAHHFTYVDMANGTLTADNTKDGIHPNADGSYAMYHQLYYSTDLATRFPR